jgi:hypothetical protein
MIYFGVRELDTNGIAHFHLYLTSDHSKMDSLDALAGIKRYVDKISVAYPADHRYKKAVCWDINPEATAIEYTDSDSDYGAVHPFARYVAGSLPHLRPVGDLYPVEIRHGALEWASTTSAVIKGRIEVNQ